MDANYPTIAPGLKYRYRGTDSELDGQVRILGPLDGYGGMEALNTNGVACDHIDRDLAASPGHFWAEREPVIEDPNPQYATDAAIEGLTVSPLRADVSFSVIVTLVTPEIVGVTSGWATEAPKRRYEVTEVRVAWSFSPTAKSPKWHASTRTKGRRVLKAGGVSSHESSLYGAHVAHLEQAAIAASRPTITPSITWSN